MKAVAAACILPASNFACIKSSASDFPEKPGSLLCCSSLTILGMVMCALL